jgi:SAM-dependent methyltransferase
LIGFFRRIFSAGEELYPYWHQLGSGLLVDLGAGSAGFCLEARNRGCSVIGLEQSSESVEIARRKGIELIQADLISPEAIELIAKAGNVVLNHVFEHVLDPVSFLQTLASSMKPGSRFILLMPNANSIWRFVFGCSWYGWDPPVHVHLYSPAALRKILGCCGFRVLDLRSIRRNDSLSTALNQIGFKLGPLRFLLRFLMIPVMPLFSYAGIGPELLCVAEIVPKPNRKQVADAP